VKEKELKQERDERRKRLASIKKRFVLEVYSENEIEDCPLLAVVSLNVTQAERLIGDIDKVCALKLWTPGVVHCVALGNPFNLVLCNEESDADDEDYNEYKIDTDLLHVNQHSIYFTTYVFNSMVETQVIERADLEAFVEANWS